MITYTGKELAVARVLSGKTARTVSAETGINKASISRIENGRENPTPIQLAKLRVAVGWSPQISFFVRMVLGPDADGVSISQNALQAHHNPQESPSENAAV